MALGAGDRVDAIDDEGRGEQGAGDGAQKIHAPILAHLGGAGQAQTPRVCGGGVPLCGVSSGGGQFGCWLWVMEGGVAGHGVQGEDAAVGQGDDGLAQGALPWVIFRS
ncbi:hypothetical protein ADENT20671_0179 [Actinomyces denticolens]|nr:hypothetical protein ADENT20671_0179 [Actinomyces denticolens]